VTRRRQARELAFRAAYQADVTGDPVERCLQEILEDLEEEPDPRRASSRRAGVHARPAPAGDRRGRLANRQELVARPHGRHDRSVIRLAAAELLYHVDVPVRVALDEAIESPRNTAWKPPAPS